jgi:hypothetical protein
MSRRGKRQKKRRGKTPRKSSKRTAHTKKGYDVEMIRDFLQHLRWELVIKHFEVTHEPGVIDEGLFDQLQNYDRKYQTLGLLWIDFVQASEDDSKEDKEKAHKILREALADYTQTMLDHLDALDVLFGKALEFSAPEYQSSPPMLLQTVKDLLSWEPSEEGERWDGLSAHSKNDEELQETFVELLKRKMLEDDLPYDDAKIIRVHCEEMENTYTLIGYRPFASIIGRSGKKSPIKAG